MPNKIQDIIDNAKIKYPLNTFSGEILKELEVVLQSSLTSLLDSIEKELPGIIDTEIDDEFINGYNSTIKKVINIINSHR